MPIATRSDRKLNCSRTGMGVRSVSGIGKDSTRSTVRRGSAALAIQVRRVCLEAEFSVRLAVMMHVGPLRWTLKTCRDGRVSSDAETIPVAETQILQSMLVALFGSLFVPLHA